MLHTLLIEPLSRALGTPTDQISLIVGLLLAYPLSSCLRYIPEKHTSLRHLYNIVSTIFLFVYVCQQPVHALAHLVLGAAISYILLIRVGGRHGAMLSLTVAMAHLAMTHIQRMYTGWGLAVCDHSGPQMVMTIKLTSLAWNVYDGSRKDAALTNPFQKTHKVSSTPSPLAFAGFLCFVGGFLVGPAFQFSDYLAYIDGSLFRIKEGKSHLPNPWPTASQYLLRGLGFLLAHVLLNPIFPESYMATLPYATKPFLYRLV